MSEEKTITIFCENDQNYYQVPLGSTLKEISQVAGISILHDEKTNSDCPVLAAIVDHKPKALSYEVFMERSIQFIGIYHEEGRRAYTRSLCFILQNAVRRLFPDKVLYIDHSLPSGQYCVIHEKEKKEDGRANVYFLTDEEIESIKNKMSEIISWDLPFRSKRMLSEDAIKIFEQQNQPLKAALLKSLGTYSCIVDEMDDIIDAFYGPLVESTGMIDEFGLTGFNDGMLLQLPTMNNRSKLLPMKKQSKLASALSEHSEWCSMLGISGIGTLNKAINDGNAIKIINLAEARHERMYAAIADEIYKRKGQAKIVMIAGPSSSGKTSSSLRIAMQCKVLGLNPKVIELDNYFIDKVLTPKDENGEYDFESLYAMNLELLNSNINDLLAGKEVEIPRYDFKLGKSVPSGNIMKLEEKDILIMEGIHALNPEMTSAVDNSKIFRVFVSALTSLNMDETNTISTSDNRMLRRMVRDNRTRGINPENTIKMWHSVRRGEARNIFPYQENADVIFNSALIFELPMLKYYAEPLLRRIPENSSAYSEAQRLLAFLDRIVALQPSEIEAIPPTSIMREFIGGQTL